MIVDASLPAHETVNDIVSRMRAVERSSRSSENATRPATGKQRTAMIPTDRNVVITGFMGTGKTTIGQRLAVSLGRPFYDMDDLVQQQFGKSIPEVFADEGEAAFRVAEAQLCARLAEDAASY